MTQIARGLTEPTMAAMPTELLLQLPARGDPTRAFRVAKEPSLWLAAEHRHQGGGPTEA
jgi:hypothetical protein